MMSQRISEDATAHRTLRWRMQEFLHTHGCEQPITAADELIDVLVNELLAMPPGSAANAYGNELRRAVHKQQS